MGLGGKISRSIKNPKKAIQRNYNRVDDLAGKKLFGNTVGFKRNLVGTKELSKGKKLNLQNDNPLAFELQKNQFLLLPNFFTNSLIDDVRTQYDQLIENDDTSIQLSVVDGKSYSRHIMKPLSNLPILKKFIDEKIMKILSDFYGRNFMVKQVNCFRNYHVPQEIATKHEMFADHWHCDRRNISEIKLFVCLRDVTEKDGPFHVQTLERTKQLMKLGFGTREDYNISKDELENHQFMKSGIGSSGTAYFANANLCLHKAGIPESGHFRDLINFVFVPTDDPLPDDWEKNVVDTLTKNNNPLV